MNRRSLLKSAGALTATLATGSLTDALAAQTSAPASPPDLQAHVPAPTPPAPTGPFTLPPLPYAYDALEPYIDAETMHLHHDKHHAAYVNNLNAAVAGHPDLASQTPTQLVSHLSSLPETVRTAVRNQGGGDVNHTFWWPTLSKSGGTAPKAELAKDIDAKFGSLSAFQTAFAKAGAGVFGSGWAWLTRDSSGALLLETTANQDSPLSLGHTPILGIDVWEHAYYLKYQNRRPEYITAFMKVINWDLISGNYAAMKQAKS